MITKKITMEVPIRTYEKIIAITDKDTIFMDHVDFIMHAITDLLEKYQ